MFLRLEFGEQLARLASICLKGMYPDQVTSNSAVVSQADSKSVLGSDTTAKINFAS